MLRLDYVSCVLTVVSTILVGRRFWEGWLLAAINSVIICVIAVRTAQVGFIPANLFCIVLYGINLRTWRKEQATSWCAGAWEQARSGWMHLCEAEVEIRRTRA